MRKYAALYNYHTDSHSIIFQDDYDGYWSVYQSSVKDLDTAKEIAEALNKVEQDQL